MKIIILISYNILTSSASEEGYHLLKCIRSYQKLDTLLAFEVHTTQTLDLLSQELCKLSKLLLVSYLLYYFKALVILYFYIDISRISISKSLEFSQSTLSSTYSKGYYRQGCNQKL